MIRLHHYSRMHSYQRLSSEFPEAFDISSEVVTEIEGGSSTVVLSSPSGPIILSVLAESREELVGSERSLHIR